LSNPDTTASRLIAADDSQHTRSEIGFALREAFLRPAQPYIDAFLGRRSELLERDKLAIAYCLTGDAGMRPRVVRSGALTTFTQNRLASAEVGSQASDLSKCQKGSK
jgi:hypothetical protein